MRSYKTEAIILKKRNFAEADRILTCFTKKLGKVNLLAKGARRLTSRKGGSLELLNWCKLSVVTGQSLDLILESEVKRSFLPVKSNLFKTSLAYQLIEVADKLTIEHQPSQKLFDLLISTLTTLSIEPNRLKQKLTVAAFQLKTLQILGFYSLQRPFFFKLVPGAVINSILQLSPEELGKLKFEPRNINTIFEDSRILVEEVAEKQIKSSKFVEELDNYHQVTA